MGTASALQAPPPKPAPVEESARTAVTDGHAWTAEADEELRRVLPVVRDTPVLADWIVALAFPCQRPFDHHNGVAEVPKFRVLPDRGGQDAANK